jgi:hypothetical protein
MSDAPAHARPAPVDPVCASTAVPTDSAHADTHAVFAELVCADPELLQAEFDALIAANFPPEDGSRSRNPPRQPGPTGTDRAAPVPPAVPSPRSGPHPGPRGRTGTDPAARERGPPRSIQDYTNDRAGQTTKEVIGTDRTGSPRPMPDARHHDDRSTGCLILPSGGRTPAPARRTSTGDRLVAARTLVGP